jgi:transcriptional regulator EpsA
MMTAMLESGSAVEKAASLLSMFTGALAARSQAGLSRWLQGEIQVFLPHDALIAAWGDFGSGELEYDVITRSPSLCIQDVPRQEIERLIARLHERWLAGDQEPLKIDPDEQRSDECPSFCLARHLLVHGVQDHRGRYDCMYLFLGGPQLATRFSSEVVRLMLPFIDTAFRQLPDRGKKQAEQELWGTGFSSSSFAGLARRTVPPGGALHAAASPLALAPEGAGERGAPLSARELEIMEWVRMGKTNSEIAAILTLSTFTVKNHMRRIYRKLDVLNRAQAVGSLDRMRAAALHAAR